METITLLSAIAAAWKIVDFFKFLTSKEWRSAVTQAVTWVVMIVVLWLFAESDFSSTTLIGDISFQSLNFASLVLLGITFGSTASVALDFKRARDNTDSAATPPLIPKRLEGGDGQDDRTRNIRPRSGADNH